MYVEVTYHQEGNTQVKELGIREDRVDPVVVGVGGVGVD